MSDVTDTILSLRNIDKAFPGVRALDNVSFECRRGEVHALVGENGAGKSTLMKILCGAYRPDKGTIVFDGRTVQVNSPHEAQALGISIIYQEFNLVPYLTVAQNIFLGREPVTASGNLDYAKMRREAGRLLDNIGVHLDLSKWATDLTVAEQQMVEIAKSLSFKAKLVIMDEPTSALSMEETKRLFEIICSLKKEGISVVYISHRIREIFEVADRVTVLKDGQVVATEPVGSLDENRLVGMMIGRTLDVIYPQKGPGGTEPILSVRGLSRAGAYRDVSFDLHKGEILGLAGLVGAGRTAVARAIFGVDPVDSGAVLLSGHQVTLRTPKDAVAHGIGLVPEDRKGQGLVLCLSIRSNVVLSVLYKLRRFLFARPLQERQIAEQQVSSLDIRTPSIEHEVQWLSGGNQQKVVLARWLAAAPHVIIFDEPTRGIDVGAKAEIHRLMRELADNGAGILMISSEMPEIIGMSDRVMVMCEGRMVGSFVAEQITEERILAAAAGIC